MNRTTIEWTDYTWNPNGQGCPHGCWYCYAKRGARRNYFMHLALYKKGKRKKPPCELCRDFKPHFHPERLDQPWTVKTPSKVFVDSTADLFADEIRPIWRYQIFTSMGDCPVKHTFQLLTKKPQNIEKNMCYPYNWWFGVTVCTEAEMWRINELLKVLCSVHFASFEPLLGMINFNEKVSLKGLQWIIIGKLTGSNKVKLKREWVDAILAEALKYNIPVFMKNNLGLKNPIQKHPKIIR